MPSLKRFATVLKAYQKKRAIMSWRLSMTCLRKDLSRSTRPGVAFLALPIGEHYTRGKSSSYALRFQCREVVKDKRLCGTNKKIAYEKPTLIDFAGVRDAAYETVTVAVRQGQPAQSALAGVTQTHSAGVGIRPPSPTV